MCYHVSFFQAIFTYVLYQLGIGGINKHKQNINRTTFDDTLRETSHFHFYWHLLSIKLIIKNNSCGNTSTKGFLALLNQVLAFLSSLTQEKKLGRSCCFTVKSLSAILVGKT